jgi:hypothetical protein
MGGAFGPLCPLPFAALQGAMMETLYAEHDKKSINLMHIL